MKKNLSLLKQYNFGDKYSVDEYGVVYIERKSKYSPDKEKLKPFINKYGYVEYSLYTLDGKYKHIQAHRLVAMCFIPNDECKKYVNHIDGDKQNNHISNLEWCTASENEIHSHHVLGKVPWNKGKKTGRLIRDNKVAMMDANGIVEKIYNSPSEAELDGYNLKQISAVCNGRQRTHKGKIWKYI